jgi:vancomycin resistance protein VanW
MKKYIPETAKLNYHLSARFAKDLFKGHSRRFAKPDREQIAYNGMIEVRQPIRPQGYMPNKLHNIRLASKEIGRIQILPKEIFSFWKTVGKPSLKKGYKNGREIINGELLEGVGGGLCQLAGIIYHGSLRAGMEVVERHPHSVDIYVEEERYTPLGADAAITYGYKDLRLRNPYPFAMKYSFIIREGELSCRIFMEDKVFPKTVEFLRETQGEKELVQTIISDSDGNKKELGVSEYFKQLH